jgi:hypothetical protein
VGPLLDQELKQYVDMDIKVRFDAQVLGRQLELQSVII